MAAYKYMKKMDGTTATNVISRTSDGAMIPRDSGNRDWVVYQAWLLQGNTPDPA